MIPFAENRPPHPSYPDVIDLALRLPARAVVKLTLLSIVETDPSLTPQPMSSTQIWSTLGQSLSRRSIERSLSELEKLKVIHRTSTEGFNNVKLMQININNLRALAPQQTPKPRPTVGAPQPVGAPHTEGMRQPDGARHIDAIRQPDGARHIDAMRQPDGADSETGYITTTHPDSETGYVTPTHPDSETGQAAPKSNELNRAPTAEDKKRRRARINHFSQFF